MNELKIFENAEFGQVRTATISQAQNFGRLLRRAN